MGGIADVTTSLIHQGRQERLSQPGEWLGRILPAPKGPPIQRCRIGPTSCVITDCPTPVSIGEPQFPSRPTSRPSLGDLTFACLLHAHAFWERGNPMLSPSCRDSIAHWRSTLRGNNVVPSLFADRPRSEDMPTHKKSQVSGTEISGTIVGSPVCRRKQACQENASLKEHVCPQPHFCRALQHSQGPLGAQSVARHSFSHWFEASEAQQVRTLASESLGILPLSASVSEGRAAARAFHNSFL